MLMKSIIMKIIKKSKLLNIKNNKRRKLILKMKIQIKQMGKKKRIIIQ
jgi:hypothetical protein